MLPTLPGQSRSTPFSEAQRMRTVRCAPEYPATPSRNVLRSSSTAPRDGHPQAAISMPTLPSMSTAGGDVGCASFLLRPF